MSCRDQIRFVSAALISTLAAFLGQKYSARATPVAPGIERHQAMAPSGTKRMRAAAAVVKDSARKSQAKTSNEDIVEKSSRQWVINYITKHPDEVVHIRAHLEEGLHLPKKCSKSGSVDAPMWHDTYMTFKSVPKYWWASLMVKVGAEFGLTKSVVDQIDAKDKHGIRRLATFLFGVSESTYLPRPCLRKVVCAQFLQHLGELMGSRWEHVKDGLVKTDGSLDWQRYGVYECVWEGDKVGTLRHRPKQFETALTDINVIGSGGWSLECNWSDVQGVLTNGKFKPMLKDLFQVEADYFATFTTSCLKQLAEEVRTKYDQEYEEKVLTPDAKILHTAQGLAAESAQKKRKANPPPRGNLLVPVLAAGPRAEEPIPLPA